MNVLITNSVPLNGGDEALLRAVIESLRTRWPQSEITVLCKQSELAREFLPDLRLAPDLEFVKDSTERELVSRLYRNADVVLSAPGGFLNDFYGIEDRLRGFEVALALRKPVVLLAQSIGPFWRSSSRQRVAEVLNRVSQICVRDATSEKCLLDLGIQPSKICLTTDAAFLWYKLEPNLFQSQPRPVRTVGLSFRVWPLDDSAAFKQIVVKAELLCRYLLTDEKRNLVFLSTCQGVPGYIDDSLVALEVVGRLSDELQARCRVDRQRRAPRELIKAIGEFEAFIGMRLHGCILAMLAGTPAMGLGYEKKTEELFKQLGLEAYQLAFEKDADAWTNQAARFLSEIDDVRRHLPAAIKRAAELAAVNIDVVDNVLRKIDSQDVAAANFQLPLNRKKDGDSRRPYDLPPGHCQELAKLLRRLKVKKVVVLGRATERLQFLCPEIEFIECDSFLREGTASFVSYQCDFNRQALPHDLLDLEAIICAGTLERIADVPRFLVQLRSRLMRNGNLIVLFASRNGVLGSWPKLRDHDSAGIKHLGAQLSAQEVSEQIRDAGFEVVDDGGFNQLMPTEASESLSTSIKVRKSLSLPASQFILVARRPSTERDVRQEIAKILASIPVGASFVLVDEAQWDIQEIDGRRAVPFLEEDGEYWGPPSNDDEAIRELGRLIRAGAKFMIFGAPGFWWLEYYSGFHDYLLSKFKCILETERLIVFDLQSSLIASSTSPVSRKYFLSGKAHASSS